LLTYQLRVVWCLRDFRDFLWRYWVIWRRRRSGGVSCTMSVKVGNFMYTLNTLRIVFDTCTYESCFVVIHLHLSPSSHPPHSSYKGQLQSALLSTKRRLVKLQPHVIPRIPPPNKAARQISGPTIDNRRYRAPAIWWGQNGSSTQKAEGSRSARWRRRVWIAAATADKADSQRGIVRRTAALYGWWRMLAGAGRWVFHLD